MLLITIIIMIIKMIYTATCIQLVYAVAFSFEGRGGRYGVEYIVVYTSFLLRNLDGGCFFHLLLNRIFF